MHACDMIIPLLPEPTPKVEPVAASSLAPAEGGSYSVDPETGIHTLIERTQERAIS